MNSPTKMSRDNSSPRSNDTDIVSPNSTAPTNYSPAEMRSYHPALLNQLQRDHLSPLTERFAQTSLSDRPVHVAMAKRPAPLSTIEDPFTSVRLSATAEPYKPFMRAPVPRSPIRELNEGSTPERVSIRERQATLVSPAYDNRHHQVDALGSPRRQKVQSAKGFTSDPDNGNGAQQTRYLAVEGIDPMDIDERIPGSKVTQFRAVRSP